MKKEVCWKSCSHANQHSEPEPSQQKPMNITAAASFRYFIWLWRAIWRYIAATSPVCNTPFITHSDELWHLKRPQDVSEVVPTWLTMHKDILGAGFLYPIDPASLGASSLPGTATYCKKDADFFRLQWAIIYLPISSCKACQAHWLS